MRKLRLQKASLLVLTKLVSGSGESIQNPNSYHCTNTVKSLICLLA